MVTDGDLYKYTCFHVFRVVKKIGGQGTRSPDHGGMFRSLSRFNMSTKNPLSDWLGDSILFRQKWLLLHRMCVTMYFTVRIETVPPPPTCGIPSKHLTATFLCMSHYIAVHGDVRNALKTRHVDLEGLFYNYWLRNNPDGSQCGARRERCQTFPTEHPLRAEVERDIDDDFYVGSVAIRAAEETALYEFKDIKVHHETYFRFVSQIGLSAITQRKDFWESAINCEANSQFPVVEMSVSFAEGVFATRTVGTRVGGAGSQEYDHDLIHLTLVGWVV